MCRPPRGTMSCYKNKKLIKFDDEEISCFCRKCSKELIEDI